MLGNSLALQKSTYNLVQSSNITSFSGLASATFGGLAGSGPLTLTNDSFTGVALTVGNNNSNTTFSGQLSGSGSLTKIGNGTLTLTGNCSYTGATNLNGGTVVISALNNLGNGTAINFGGGALCFNGIADISSRTVTINAGGATIDTNGLDVSFANSIGNNGAGGLTKAGSGTLTLTGINTYNGGPI